MKAKTPTMPQPLYHGYPNLLASRKQKLRKLIDQCELVKGVYHLPGTTFQFTLNEPGQDTLGVVTLHEREEEPIDLSTIDLQPLTLEA